MQTEFQKIVAENKTAIKYMLLIEKEEIKVKIFYTIITPYIRDQIVPIIKTITGITQKQLKEIVKEHNEYIEKTKLERRNLKNIESFPQILSKEKLNTWAHSVWKKRGCPRFKKRIITGIVYGEGYVVDNGKWGWDKVIRERYIGVEKIKNSFTNHIYITFYVD